MTFMTSSQGHLDGQTLPPLPQIQSESICRQVFTHRSLYARPTHVFEDHPSDPSPDNEKYEHVGDTVLSLIVTDLISETYPGLRVGPSTKVRSLVVGNSTLAEISLRYKLPDNLLLHPAQEITLRVSQNVQADVFESYVGGLFKDQSLEAVRAWLTPLLLPYIQSAYATIRAQHGLPPLSPPLPTMAVEPDETGAGPCTDMNSNEVPSTSFSGTEITHGVGNPQVAPTPLHGQFGSPFGSPQYPPLHTRTHTTSGHLALFNQRVQNNRVEWIYDSTAVNSATSPGSPSIPRKRAKPLTPIWKVRVLVDGEFHGKGRGGTKKAARNEAAKEGLAKLGFTVYPTTRMSLVRAWARSVRGRESVRFANTFLSAVQRSWRIVMHRVPGLSSWRWWKFT